MSGTELKGYVDRDLVLCEMVEAVTDEVASAVTYGNFMRSGENLEGHKRDGLLHLGMVLGLRKAMAILTGDNIQPGNVEDPLKAAGVEADLVTDAVDAFNGYRFARDQFWKDHEEGAKKNPDRASVQFFVDGKVTRLQEQEAELMAWIVRYGRDLGKEYSATLAQGIVTRQESLAEVQAELREVREIQAYVNAQG